MTTFLAMVTEVLTWLLTQVGAVSTAIKGDPLMVTPYVLLFAGAAVGFFKRMAR